MAFQPGRNVDQQRKTGRMRFRETVFAKTENLLKDLFREYFTVAAVAHAGYQFLLERLQAALSSPGSHRAAQMISFAGRKSGGGDCQLHHLFLEDWHTEGAFQHLSDFFRRIDDRIDSLTATQIRVHHAALDRTGSNDRDFDYQIIETLRSEPRQHRHLRARFDLKYADRVGTRDHLVDFRIFRRHICKREWFAMKLAYQRQSLAYCGEHAEREHVDL